MFSQIIHYFHFQNEIVLLTSLIHYQASFNHQGAENMNPFSESKSRGGGGQGPLSPFPALPQDSAVAAVGLKGKTKSAQGLDYHHRGSSDSLFIEGQPSWLDDLLNEPAETQIVVHRGHHRRSASDTFAYIGTTTEAFNSWDKMY